MDLRFSDYISWHLSTITPLVDELSNGRLPLGASVQSWYPWNYFFRADYLFSSWPLKVKPKYKFGKEKDFFLHSYILLIMYKNFLT